MKQHFYNMVVVLCVCDITYLVQQLCCWLEKYMYNRYYGYLFISFFHSVSSTATLTGFLRLLPLFTLPRWQQKSEAVALASKSCPQNIQDSFQGAGCSRTSGRLLSEPGGLVLTERAQCWTGHLRLFMECLHESGDETLWSVVWRRFSHFRVMGRKGKLKRLVSM